MSQEAKPVTTAKADDADRARRMRRGGQALMAAAAAIPASGAVSAQEAAFAAFTGPQFHVAQSVEPVQTDTAPAFSEAAMGLNADQPTDQAEPQLIIADQGGVCISVASETNSVGALITIAGTHPFTRIVDTTAPGVLPEGPEDMNCMSADDFRAYLEERTYGFINDTADLLIQATNRLGRDSSQLQTLKDPEFIASRGSLDDARMFTARAFNGQMNRLRQGVPAAMLAFAVDPDREAELIERFQAVGTELQMLATMEEVLPWAQQGIDDGSLQPLFRRLGVVVPNPGDRVHLKSGPDAAEPVVDMAAADNSAPPKPDVDALRQSWPGSRL
ncbi:MAG: hypothetical protein AAF556_03070 [Pseudomonadota bacterium]